LVVTGGCASDPGAWLQLRLLTLRFIASAPKNWNLYDLSAASGRGYPGCPLELTLSKNDSPQGIFFLLLDCAAVSD
jgi:hypothetical protein